jgi:hypothetical protein
MSAVISWGYHQIANRVSNFGYAGVRAYQGVISSALAIFNSAGNIASLGADRPSEFAAQTLATTVNSSVANTYIRLLFTINPNAKVSGLPTDQHKDTRNCDKPNCTQENHPLAVGRISISETPLALRTLAIKQQVMMRHLNQGNWLNRNITARLAAPLSAVVIIVAAAARTVLGLIAAVFSFLALGCSHTLNSWAWHGLFTPGFMINQLEHGILGFLRPSKV